MARPSRLAAYPKVPRPISDLPSRGAYDEYFAAVPGSLRVPFTLPNFSTFTGPLADLLLAFEDFFFF